MKKSAKITIAAVLAFGIIGATAANAARDHAGDHSKHAERALSFISKKLELDTTQEQALSVLRDQALVAKEAMHGEMGTVHTDFETLVQAESFDQAKALEMINNKTATVNSVAPDLVVALGNFMDSLDSVQVMCKEPLPTCELDETRIRILLRNLIGNAVDHHDDKNESVSVELCALNNCLKISVSDFGPGIAPEHIDKVTEPFYRTDTSRTRSTGGFGLGLHLASLIAKAHGGSLAINSRTAGMAKPDEPSGTTVTVQIPIS